MRATTCSTGSKRLNLASTNRVGSRPGDLPGPGLELVERLGDGRERAAFDLGPDADGQLPAHAAMIAGAGISEPVRGPARRKRRRPRAAHRQLDLHLGQRTELPSLERTGGQVGRHPLNGDVVGQHRGPEAPDTMRDRGMRQPRHQLAGQPLALVVVADDDRELGRRGIVGQPDVARDGHDRLVGLVGKRGHEGEVVGAVDLDEVPRVGRRQLRLGRQKAPVARFRRQPRMGGAQALVVVGPDRADRDRAAVVEGVVGPPYVRSPTPAEAIVTVRTPQPDPNQSPRRNLRRPSSTRWAAADPGARMSKAWGTPGRTCSSVGTPLRASRVA